MNDDVISTTIELLGKPFTIRCQASEVDSLLEAAAYLNTKMQEVQEAGKTASPERIAIITALNMTHQFLQLDHQKSSLMSRINQRLSSLQQKIDTAINQAWQTELVYTPD